VAVCAVAGLAACSSSHGPPKLSVRQIAGGNRVAYGGIALTVPDSWRALNRAPAACGSRLGRVAYVFDSSHSPPAGGSCPSYPPVGPYVSVECEPFNPQPQGRVVKLGSLSAIGLGQSSMADLTDIAFYLKKQDAELDIYASPTMIRGIESSIAGSHGSC
jgi:hypothetical protein